MTVEMERDIAEDLISYKLRSIREYIDVILTRWGETSSTSFIEKSMSGVLEEAENDGIDMRQLLLEEEKLLKLIKNIIGDE